jgi:hypothetical protein
VDVEVEEVATPEAVAAEAAVAAEVTVVTVAAVAAEAAGVAAPLLPAAVLGAETAGAAEPGEAAVVVATFGVFVAARRFAVLVAEVGVPVPEAGADAAKLVNDACACEMEL